MTGPGTAPGTDALLRVAAARGLHATGMREVAAEAGVSLRLVQYYFGTKEELLLAGMQHLAARFSERAMTRIRRIKGTNGQASPRDVIAAILTLVGYSMNDTIVVFDRIRENLRLSRRESLPDVVNRSINQTLSRTVLTSGLTFLTVLSLYVFGGQVLRGFSFALVVGILIGTYSSIAIAAPMLVAYQQWRSSTGKAVVLPAAKRART